MIRWLNDVFVQPLAVLMPGDSKSSPDVATNEPVGYKKVEATVPPSENALDRPTQVLATSFSSIPVIWRSELAQEYRGLGEALGQMTQLDEGDAWKIEPTVYGSACYVAAGLMLSAYPVPQVFNHGSQSVVFNWSHGTSNLYLTISADKGSVLISSPEKIQRRVEFSLTDLVHPGAVLAAIQPSNFEQSAPLRLTATVPEPSEIIG